MNKTQKYLYSSIVIIIIILWGVLGIKAFQQNKSAIYFNIGNRFFEGKTLGMRIYDTDLATYFIKKSDENGKPRRWSNYQLSRIYFVNGKLPEAVAYADEELRVYPDNCRTHYIRGLAYGYLENLDMAISDFENFNQCFPRTWAGHNDLAWFWFRKGNMQRVVDIISEVKGDYPNNPWLLNTYGTALLNLKRYDEAESALLIAKQSSAGMTSADWGSAYPGNSSDIYEQGLESMRSTIDKNLKLIAELKNKKEG